MLRHHIVALQLCLQLTFKKIKINKSLYLSVNVFSTGVLIGDTVYSRSNWNLEVLVFMEGGKPENPEKNPQSKDENQQQTQPTYGTGPEFINCCLLAVSILPCSLISVSIYLLQFACG